MRILLLLRGAPGCGKSTWIDNNNLRSYALSADEIRLMCQSSQMTVGGSEEISCSNDKTVWNILFNILDTRMKHGEFTVIDATNSKTSEMNRYKQMCELYRYRMFCVDFTDLPIEECKRRNAGREPLKRVPEEAIDKMYSRFRTQKIPSGIKVVKPDQLDQIWMKRFDFSEYRKIVHVGDIHGCNTALQEYFKNGLEDDVFYIFLGDYIDRGIENAEVLHFLMSIQDKKNVLMLEGNHERWLWGYANDVRGKSKEFELITRKQLDEANFDKKELRKMYRRFGQCAWYNYDGKIVFVSHGGIATMPNNLSKVATEQMIKGVGSYNDFEKIAETWMETTSGNTYQIMGHRNTKGFPIKVRDRVFNLKGRVEFGGDLRIVELTHEGFNEVYIKNEVYKTPDEIKTEKEMKSSNVADAVLELRDNKYIQEKQFGPISSFNFTKKAFYEGVWNEQTITSRGLYIDTERMKIVARGLNKFWNINEMPETKFEMLQYKLQFPVAAYVKENGFLGLVSYDYNNDELFITTKSNPDGKFAEWLREMLYAKTTSQIREDMKQYLKEHDVTFLFECVDMKHDPHVIEYPESELFFLDIVYNQLEFKHVDYEVLVDVAKRFGLKCKTKAYEIADWQEFFDWYNEVLNPDYGFDGRTIEGFVIEDAAGYMTKLKLSYYHFWKFMRSVAHEAIRNGYIRKTSALTSEEANLFYGWVRTLHDAEDKDSISKDIVTLRKMFMKQEKIQGGQQNV